MPAAAVSFTACSLRSSLATLSIFLSISASPVSKPKLICQHPARFISASNGGQTVSTRAAQLQVMPTFLSMTKLQNSVVRLRLARNKSSTNRTCRTP